MNRIISLNKRIKNIKALMELVEKYWDEDDLKGTKKQFIEATNTGIGNKEYLKNEVELVKNMYWMDKVTLDFSTEQLDELYIELDQIKDTIKVMDEKYNNDTAEVENLLSKHKASKRIGNIIRKIYKLALVQ